MDNSTGTVMTTVTYFSDNYGGILLRSIARGRNTSSLTPGAVAQLDRIFRENYLSRSGGRLVGDLDMGGFEIENSVITSDRSVVNRGWALDTFPTRGEVYGGFDMLGTIDMNGNPVEGVPDPATDSSAINRRYLVDNFVG